MAAYPERCPSCGEPNNAGLHYCAVCGMRFKVEKSRENGGDAPEGRSLSGEQKLRMKKLKRKREIIDLYRSKKITREQFTRGMAKLGYSTDTEKALAFKKFIKEQIQAFEKMDVSGDAGGYHHDPNESESDLPRDEYGNVITDFSIGAGIRARPHSVAPSLFGTSEHRREIGTTSGGPVFGEGLMQDSRRSGRREDRREIPKAKLKHEMPQTGSKKPHSRKTGIDLDWDEDTEEEEFEIDLDEVESGWWDDDEWELEWSDEDEWEDWGIDPEEDWEEDPEDEEFDEDEFETESWEEDELPEGVSVEFEDDEFEIDLDEEEESEDEDSDELEDDEISEEEDDGDVFDPRKYHRGRDDDDWGGKGRRRRRRG